MCEGMYCILYAFIYNILYMNNKLLLNTNAHVHRTAVTGRVHRPVFRSERVPRRPAPTLLLFRTCSPVGLGILILRGGGGDRVVT